LCFLSCFFRFQRFSLFSLLGCFGFLPLKKRKRGGGGGGGAEHRTYLTQGAVMGKAVV